MPPELRRFDTLQWIGYTLGALLFCIAPFYLERAGLLPAGVSCIVPNAFVLLSFPLTASLTKRRQKLLRDSATTMPDPVEERLGVAAEPLPISCCDAAGSEQQAAADSHETSPECGSRGLLQRVVQCNRAISRLQIRASV